MYLINWKAALNSDVLSPDLNKQTSGILEASSTVSHDN